MIGEKFTLLQYSVGGILGLIETGQFVVPEIQRPFVWKKSQVRDLIDSLYNGYPTGYIITSKNPDVKIKEGGKSNGKHVLIDGQQRITALMAAVAGKEILDEDFNTDRIRIAFNPFATDNSKRFAVQDASHLKDKRWIPDISVVFSVDFKQRAFENEYAKENDERFIIVDNVLRALQQLASFHRKQTGIPVIGITGTNGKTTTKELMATVLSQSYKVLYTKGNLNNHIGVPLTLLQLTKEHDMAVIEMGASHPGEIALLAEIADPDFGLITNVGKAHLQGFGSFEGVIKTKGELYDYLRKKNGKIFINKDNPYLCGIAQGLTQIGYGTQDGLFVCGQLTEADPFMSLSWKYGSDNRQTTAHTRLIGAYNLENALAAIATGHFFNIKDEQIKEALENYTPTNSRSQLKKTARHNTLIIDAYNANPTSMNAAISNFREIKTDRKMAILGDMGELGAVSAEEHQRIADMLKEAKFDVVWLVGDEFSRTDCQFRKFKNVEEVKAAIAENRPEGYCILIKGSNSMKLFQLPALL